MEAELRTLFFTAVESFATANSYPVAFPNVAFTKPNGPTYLKVAALPADPEVHGVNNGASHFIWVLQVSVFVRDGIGEIKPATIADSLRDTVFPIHSTLDGDSHSFKVMTPPSPAPSIPMDGWHSTPVRFRVSTIH